MPTYGTITYKAGFYNNKKDANGNDDRAYTAEDLRKPYTSIYSRGLKPEADGTAGEKLKVTATGGMKISVAAGEANLGAWFENESAFNITLDNSTGADRYDCVIIRNDDTDNVRMPSIYIKSLTRVPTIDDLTRTDKIYEICVAYVKVPALATEITQSNITDTRESGQLCNVMSGVGATVVRTLRNTVYSDTANQRNFAIGISQFDTARDQLTVIIEGRILSETAYTIASKWTVSLDMGLPVIGTRVDFVVTKSVNAAGADTVVQEVGALINEMALVNKTLENHYYCNGQTDNVHISDIVKKFLEGGNYGSLDLKVHGTFGAVAPVSGTGVSTSAYKWFDFYNADATRRVTIDFTDCSQINLPITNGTYNIAFYADYIRIVGANLFMQNTAAGTNNRIFSSAKGEIFAENCRFYLSGYSGANIAECGTFTNCRASVTNATGHSYCFTSASTTLLRINGGEYYAYTASNAHYSAIVGLTSGTDAVAILYAVNAPTVARSGYYQTHALYQTTGIISCTDIISALELNVVSGASNICGTIAKSKAGLM